MAGAGRTGRTPARALLAATGLVTTMGLLGYLFFVLATAANVIGPVVIGRPVPWLVLQFLAVATVVATVATACPGAAITANSGATRPAPPRSTHRRAAWCSYRGRSRGGCSSRDGDVSGVTRSGVPTASPALRPTSAIMNCRRRVGR